MSKPKITSTEAVHAGEPRAKPYDAVPTPIVQTATYTFKDSAEIAAFTGGDHPDPDRGEYGRYGNPTVRGVEQRLAALEGTEDAALFASGMAALTTTVLALVRTGQHVVLFRDCYRMTLEFTTDVLDRFGVTHTLLEAGDVASLPSALRPETRLVVSESPTNPYLSCIDLSAVAGACKAHRTVKSIIDATFATPVNCRPAKLRHRSGRSQRHQVPRGPQRRARGRRVRTDRPGVPGARSARCARRRGRSPRRVPRRAWAQDAGAARRAPERDGAAPGRAARAAPSCRARVLPGPAVTPQSRRRVRADAGFGGVLSFIVKGGLAAASGVVDAMRVARIAPSFGGVEPSSSSPR